MTCYHPMTVFQREGINPKTGKGYKVEFWPPYGSDVTIDKTHVDSHGRTVTITEVRKLPPGWKQIQIPCGQCIGCRLERARQWACRCMHEASMHEFNSFITLTFDDDHLNPDMSLRKEDYVLFMKRLRKYFDSRYSQQIRFFHCGEYGDLNLRPHHHAILFGCDFPDKVLWSERNGVRLYRSAILERLWPFGFSTIGNVTFESCGYVARYVLKKITGRDSRDYYGSRVPPYVTMSRRPGIGMQWLEKYVRDVYPNDFIVVRNGVLCKPPRYYDDMYNYLQGYLQREDLAEIDTIDEIKERRRDRAMEQKARLYADEYEEMERLTIKEYIKEKRIENLKRNL